MPRDLFDNQANNQPRDLFAESISPADNVQSWGDIAKSIGQGDYRQAMLGGDTSGVEALARGAAYGADQLGTTALKAVVPDYMKPPVQSSFNQNAQSYMNNPATNSHPILAGLGNMGAQFGMTAPLGMVPMAGPVLQSAALGSATRPGQNPYSIVEPGRVLGSAAVGAVAALPQITKGLSSLFAKPVSQTTPDAMTFMELMGNPKAANAAQTVAQASNTPSVLQKLFGTGTDIAAQTGASILGGVLGYNHSGGLGAIGGSVAGMASMALAKGGLKLTGAAAAAIANSPQLVNLAAQSGVWGTNQYIANYYANKLQKTGLFPAQQGDQLVLAHPDDLDPATHTTTTKLKVPKPVSTYDGSGPMTPQDVRMTTQTVRTPGQPVIPLDPNKAGVWQGMLNQQNASGKLNGLDWSETEKEATDNPNKGYPVGDGTQPYSVRQNASVYTGWTPANGSRTPMLNVNTITQGQVNGVPWYAAANTGEVPLPSIMQRNPDQNVYTGWRSEDKHQEWLKNNTVRRVPDQNPYTGWSPAGRHQESVRNWLNGQAPTVVTGIRG